mmetsp:Transcript_11890/g.26736  ORF Transcript_11890/g.26736 Transcript_11890/m.26736 type:complete len:129 (+) Transcript_11890:2-388(+)
MYAKTRGMALRCRWNVYHVATQERETYRTCTPPTQLLEEFYPNFELYSRSITPWSPDSSHFTFSAAVTTIGADGYGEVREGAWVQAVSPPRDADPMAQRASRGPAAGLEAAEPFLAVEGASFAVWSPS